MQAENHTNATNRIARIVLPKPVAWHDHRRGESSLRFPVKYLLQVVREPQSFRVSFPRAFRRPRKMYEQATDALEELIHLADCGSNERIRHC